MTTEGIAEQLASKQQQVSIAEFFERNRHLLGFDNKRKALLTVVKEAVDNSLDACEEASILPELQIEIVQLREDRYRVSVQDNGPGLPKKAIPKVFAKLLYGSKFHSFKQARGQQGIGISAACLYSQLTTGKAARITSKVKGKKASYTELRLDTKKNEPFILLQEERDWEEEHGVKIELDLEASYQGGSQSVDSYIKQTAIVNPHATIVYTNPKAEQLILARVTNELPAQAQEIKPHPYGVEIGILQKMLENTDEKTLHSFLTNAFSRVSSTTAKKILETARLLPRKKPQEMKHADIEQLIEGIQETKIIAPPTDCIVPIGSELLEKGLRKELQAEFYTSISRAPQIYKGIPFLIEVALAYGGNQKGDSPITVYRYANKVPLLYQLRAGASYKAITNTNWRSYGLSQSTGNLPLGALTVAIHVASIHPPFTSEAKEALAHYTEIIKEMTLALQETGRKLGTYLNKKKRVGQEQERVQLFEAYIPEAAVLLGELTGQTKQGIQEVLTELLEKNKAYLVKNKGIGKAIDYEE